MSIKNQKIMCKFLRKYPDTWHTFASDRETVENVCGLHNLGIATVKGDMFILRSAEKADRWMYSHD